MKPYRIKINIILYKTKKMVGYTPIGTKFQNFQKLPRLKSWWNKEQNSNESAKRDAIIIKEIVSKVILRFSLKVYFHTIQGFKMILTDGNS